MGFFIKIKIVDNYIVLRYSDYIEVRYIVVRWCGAEFIC